MHAIASLLRAGGALLVMSVAPGSNSVDSITLSR
jgi:hypothetical protein